MKNKMLMTAIASMLAAIGGGWGRSPGKAGVERPNSDRIKNLSDSDLEWYRSLPKQQRVKLSYPLRAKYMWGV